MFIKLLMTCLINLLNKLNCDDFLFIKFKLLVIILLSIANQTLVVKIQVSDFTYFEYYKSFTMFYLLLC